MTTSDQTRPGSAVIGAEAPVEVQQLTRICADATLQVAAGHASPGQPAPVVRSIDPRQRLTPLAVLGKGAMGEVLVAQDTGLCRKVALKRMLPEVAHDPALAARFFEEIQVTAQLDHPNVVPIYNLEVGEGGGLAYSMKLVQGKTLTALLAEARQQLDAGHARDERERLATHLDVLLKVCDGIAYAHSKGVLHRDLKPDNIMVGRYNEVYVMDWGICRIMGQPDAEGEAGTADATQMIDTDSSGTQRTQFGVVIGTPAYMSPEQAKGMNPVLDGRSDLYSLGLILQEVVTLRRAMQGKTMNELMRKAAHGERSAIQHYQSRRRIATELQSIIARATAPKPGDRYAGVAELAADIRRYLRGEAVLARPDSPLQATLRFVSRHRAASLVTIIVLMLLGVSANLALLWKADRARLAAQQHEQKLTEFLGVSSHQREVIDDQFFRYNGALEQFSGRVLQALQQPAAASVYYQTADFDRGAVPDLADSSYYGSPMSVQWASIKLAPGVEETTVQQDLHAFAALGPAFAALSLRSEGSQPAQVSGPDARQLILEEGVPVLRSFVTLANGAHAGYPGHGGLPPDYDGRTRPKYKLALDRHGIQWGNPYPDRFGKGLLLPASVALYDDQQQFRGVAGLDITFQYLITHILDLPPPPYVKETLLVDGQGQVIIRSTAQPHVAGQPFGDARDVLAQQEAENDEVLALPKLPYPSLLQAMNGDRFGYQMVPQQREVVAYFPLEALGWYFVVVADSERLFGTD